MSNTTVQYHECPHCYSNVMFHRDGRCPSCRKNKFDTQHADLNKTMVTIDQNHQLPACCFLCGEQTPLIENLSWSYDKGTAPSLLARLLSYVPGSPHRETHDIAMPVCMTCVPLAKRVQPLSVVAGLECRLVVHRNFRRQFEQLNGKEYIEWQADIRVTHPPQEHNLDATLPVDIFKILSKR